jgi:methylamine---glutamate N-methyltransferase subunit B
MLPPNRLPVPTDPEKDGGQAPPIPSLSIPEIRDYQKINAELVALLDRGHRLIRLEGAEGQRLLASGLRGQWNAVVEIVGPTGPEVAANLDATGLTVIAKGSTADGAARGLKSGRIIILGDAGDASGYEQSGGILVITGSAGHRGGLAQSGGILAILGSTGRLACDRQSGGRLFLPGGTRGPNAGRGRQGGRLIDRFGPDRLDDEDKEAWQAVLDLAEGLVDASLFPPR